MVKNALHFYFKVIYYDCRKGTEQSPTAKLNCIHKVMQIKSLIIFPLIIYYSGSSKRSLLLFEF